MLAWGVRHFVQTAIIIETMIKRHLEAIQKPMPRFKIKHMTSQWGDCDKNGVLSFNPLLIFAPKFVIEYVVVHEMCHLVYRNHDKAFWELLKQIVPDYTAKSLWLDREGAHLSA